MNNILSESLQSLFKSYKKGDLRFAKLTINGWRECDPKDKRSRKSEYKALR